MKIELQLGMRIKYLRKRKGMTQEELSLICGVTRKYMSDLEVGRRNPTLKTLEKIANGLEIDISELTKGLRSF
ncbi:MAG: helix-turn-helix transcriptional regulator [Bacilli bacterium]|nr:helix-turn-helix transcriptional regulator [Bacilli bacterium]